jgi:glycine betaine/proline transport system permease protein
MIGAGGLGYQVLQGIGRLEVSRGLFAGLGIVALAIIFDRVTQAFGKRLQARIGLAEAR